MAHLFRLVLVAALLVVGGGTLLIYRHVTAKDSTIARLERENARLESVLERLATERRVAELVVTEQRRDQGRSVARVIFVEQDAQGRSLPARSFDVMGDRVHVDALVVKFDRDLVRADDPLRGHAVMVFERVYGSAQAPADVPTIDTPGQPPAVFRVGPGVSRLEADLWRDFWALVTDPDAREARGVRAAHGAGVFGPLKAGTRYTVTLTPDGEITLVGEPLPEAFRAALKWQDRP
jgi:hypothetical protein